MLGFGKEKLSQKQQLANHLTDAPKSNEDLLKKEIFSASDAKEMGIEAKNKKRNNNRREVFRIIKAQITYGSSMCTIDPTYLADGNDVYFEGLGYKLKTVWIDSMGQYVEEKPAPTLIHPQPQMQGASGYYGQQSYNYVPVSYIDISWE